MGMNYFLKKKQYSIFGETSFYGIVRDNPCIESPSKPYRYYDSFVRDIEKGIKIESLMRKYSFKKPFHIRLLEKIKRELRNLFLCIQKKKEHRR